MTAPFNVVAKAVRTILIANDTTLPDYVLDAGIHKIFPGVAPGTVAPPYVLITHLSGGETNEAESPSIDMYIRVAVVSPDMVKAEQQANNIYDLIRGSRPTMTDGWRAWIPISHTADYRDIISIQNKQFHAQGSFFRVRAVRHIGS